MPGRGPLMETTPFITREKTAGNDVVVLELEGSLDITTVETFETRLKELAEHEKSRLVIDMEKLQYISSAGIGALMFFIKRFRGQRGDIKIANVNPGVYRIFELMELPNIFQITETVGDALDAFGGKTHETRA
jgi:anti-anti-sigma factor